MRRFLFAIALGLLAFTAYAQDPAARRVYQINSHVFVCATTTDDCRMREGGMGVDFSSATNQVVIRSVLDNLEYRLLPSQFLNQAGTAYGATLTAARTAWEAHLQTTGANAFGTNAPTLVDYTTTSSIATTGAVGFLIENMGTASTTLTYGGLSYTLQPGDQRQFSAQPDPSTNRLNPLLALTVVGTASAPLRVLTFRIQ
ncbi:hypothetical protein [Fibrella aestuarina]|nr:hypothetical protein [Fibrella aestuarina]